MLTALCDGEIVRAKNVSRDSGKAFLCRDPDCTHPELQLVVGSGIRIPYFRHAKRGKCGCSDGETEWHLAWKDQFDRIEVDMGVDEVTGERNRADAVVGDDFVIEFQHSPIKDEERLARQRFYGSKGGMVWVVDANKPGRHKAKERAIRDWEFCPCREPELKGYMKVMLPRYMLGEAWAEREVGVVFDYGPDEDLLFMLPYDGEMGQVGRYFKREELIAKLKDDPRWFLHNKAWHINAYRNRIREEAEAKRQAELKAKDDAKAAARQARERAVEERKKRFFEARDAAAKRALERQRNSPPSRFSPLEPIEGFKDWVVDPNGSVWQLVNGRLWPVRNIDFSHGL